MKTPTKVVLTTLAFGTLAFLANPAAPLGALLWPPNPHSPAPTGALLPILAAASALEAVLFGLGVAFLFWGWSLVKRTGARRGLAFAAYLSIVWLLVSWFPHDNLHVHYGEDLGAIAALVWGFHITLGLSGVVLAAFALDVGRRATETARAAAAAAVPASAAAPVR